MIYFCNPRLRTLRHFLSLSLSLFPLSLSLSRSLSLSLSTLSLSLSLLSLSLSLSGLRDLFCTIHCVCKASLNGHFKTERSMIELLVCPYLCSSLTLRHLVSCRFPATHHHPKWYCEGYKNCENVHTAEHRNTNNANKQTSTTVLLCKEGPSTRVNSFFHTFSVHKLPKTQIF